MTTKTTNETIAADAPDPIQEPRLWRGNGWTARVVKNEDDEGWAVEMTLDGESEPALVGPWTMGRDKKNPKPLDASAFNTLVKTAGEFRQRQVQQLHATLHQNITINAAPGASASRSTSCPTTTTRTPCLPPTMPPAKSSPGSAWPADSSSTRPVRAHGSMPAFDGLTKVPETRHTGESRCPVPRLPGFRRRPPRSGIPGVSRPPE
jgi:hypothetical protein